jgi:DNA-binding XRE family transcriptional regulator
MNLSDMIPLDEEIERARQANPDFRALWDSQAFAREVAHRIIAYRADHGLTQDQLGKLVGISQPAVAMLESGEDAPTLKTMAKVSAATDLEFHLDISHGQVLVAA